MMSFIANERYHRLLLVLLLIASMLLLLGRFYMTKSIAGGDAVYYYSNARSLVIDRDFDFRNEFMHFYEEVSPYTGFRKIEKPPSMKVLPDNKYPIGSAIFLAPFFLIAHVVALLLQKAGMPVTADGYSAIYQIAAGLGSLLYTFAGIVLVYYLGKKLFDPAIAMIGAAVIWLATPLIYYSTMEPLMVHTISMFCVTLFIFIWYMTRDNRQFYQWVILGLVGGLLSIVRYQDATFLLIPVVDTVISKFRKSGLYPKSWIYYGFAFLGFFTAALLGASPQLYENKVFYGSAFANGYGHNGEGFIYWSSPKILYSLFSTHDGLLLWSPIIVFSLIGLFWLSRKRPLVGLLLSGFFLLQLYLVSSWWAPDQGHTFGNRMLLNSVVIYAAGLMQFLFVIKERKTSFLKYAVIVSVVFVLLNGVLSGLYCFRIIGQPYSYTPTTYHN